MFVKQAVSAGPCVEALRKYQTTNTNCFSRQSEPVKATATRNALGKDLVYTNPQVSHAHLPLLLQQHHPSTESTWVGTSPLKHPTRNLTVGFLFLIFKSVPQSFPQVRPREELRPEKLPTNSLMDVGF